MPVCTGCKRELKTSDFGRDSAKKSGIKSRCKDCVAGYRLSTKDYQAEYRAKNKEAIKACTARWREENIDRVRASAEKRCASDEYREYQKMYYQENKARLASAHRDYVEKNAEKIKAKKLEWQRINREKLNARKRERFASDPIFAMREKARNRIRFAIRRGGYSVKSSSQEILGCSWEHFKSHIEKQFKDGMSWGNMEKWHLDHVVPLASADDMDSLLPLLRYENLAPLWAEENLKKGARISHDPQAEANPQA